jgi:F0F1-type ATP synthase assembly protein I
MEALFIALAVLLGLFVGWLVAEFRAGPFLRIVLGLACILGLASGGIFLVRRGCEQQITFHRAGLRYIDELLEQGKQAKVRQAIRAFEEEQEAGEREFNSAVRLQNELWKGLVYGDE